MAVNIVQRRFFSQGLKKWAYNLSGFNRYGLWRDDLLDDMQDSDIKEAIRRLPQDQLDARNYRILRAVQLSIQKDILPKDQWTKFEDDKHYLLPYLEEVRKENEERDEWNKNY